jgi:hypothetical protein
MGGGLVQLVATGAQDIYLTSQPQITFWKSVYRRYTNYAIESVSQQINGQAKFGSRISVTINRTGDLLKNLWLQYDPQEVLSGVIPALPDDIVGANVGHSIVNSMELEINNQTVDRQYGKWLTIWNYLTETDSTGVQGSVGYDWEEPSFDDTAVNYDGERSTRYNIMAYTHRAGVSVGSANFDLEGDPRLWYYPPNQAYVPLRFWFCRNPGLAIPLIALQYVEIKLLLVMGTADGIYYRPPPGLPTPGSQGREFQSLTVWADYVYLDASERRQFSQNAHEYLIDQHQCMHSVTDKNINLIFNHPVKELLWSTAPEPVGPGLGPGLWPNSTVVPGLSSPSRSLADSHYQLFMNGLSRQHQRDLKYYTRNQIWDYHTGYGSILFPNSLAVYSFSLRPEEHQPSGTCNFSRLDSSVLVRQSDDPIDIYAINYNILRVMSGSAGLAYS